MNSKSFLIAIAAFAVTTTGAHAYVGSKQLQRAGLSPEQVSAFVEARSLLENGEADKARDLLVSAGVDEQAVKRLAKAKDTTKGAMRAAIDKADFLAFRQAADGTPIYDIIVTEDDFRALVEAHRLWHEGELEAANDTLSALGFPAQGLKELNKRHHFRSKTVDRDSYYRGWLNLSKEEREAYRTAMRANDKDTAQAILEAAGVMHEGVKYRF
jgi:hypothetical protein